MAMRPVVPMGSSVLDSLYPNPGHHLKLILLPPSPTDSGNNLMTVSLISMSKAIVKTLELMKDVMDEYVGICSHV